jgi:hypothetical protein
MEIVGNFQQFAASTGAKPCFWRTDLHNCLREVVDDARDYYMLGYYLDKKTTPGWHVLSVKTEQKAELRYRTGFGSRKERRCVEGIERHSVGACITTSLHCAAFRKSSRL